LVASFSGEGCRANDFARLASFSVRTIFSVFTALAGGEESTAATATTAATAAAATTTTARSAACSARSAAAATTTTARSTATTTATTTTGTLSTCSAAAAAAGTAAAAARVENQVFNRGTRYYTMIRCGIRSAKSISAVQGCHARRACCACEA